MAPLRRWLIDWPARIVDVYWRTYWTIVFMLTTMMLLVTAASLVLTLFGIRWGW